MTQRIIRWVSCGIVLEVDPLFLKTSSEILLRGTDRRLELQVLDRNIEIP